MGGFLNPGPFKVGGGPTLVEKIYRQMRESLGRNGAGPKGGIEDTWRMCRAVAWAKALVAVERAALRAFPNRGGESIPVWEGVLGLAGAPTLGERVEAVTAAYSQQFDAVLRGIEQRLQAIDASITITVPSTNTTSIARAGKPFKLDSAVDGDTALFPAFDESAIVFVKWAGGIPDATKRRSVERILNRDLAAFYDWRIYNTSGFYCDGFNDSYTDLTLLG